jgi:ATP-dependent RNA helicase RhlE
LLLLHLLNNKNIPSALVFTRTKHGADKVVKFLHQHKITAAAIHGNKSQNARQHALNSFKESSIRVLVATDIAARGIDIDELSHVFNFELPDVAETYVHRIGRTGRAGNTGTAIAFCEAEERILLRDIQKLIGKNIPVVAEHPYLLSASEMANLPSAPAGKPVAPKRTRSFGSNSQQGKRFSGRKRGNNFAKK